MTRTYTVTLLETRRVRVQVNAANRRVASERARTRPSDIRIVWSAEAWRSCCEDTLLEQTVESVEVVHGK